MTHTPWLAVAVTLLSAATGFAQPTIEVEWPNDAPATAGRLVVAVAPKGSRPRLFDPGSNSTVVIGQDVRLTPGARVRLDPARGGTVVVPAQDALAQLAPGEYAVRACVMGQWADRRPEAPGNRTGTGTVTLAPGQVATIRLGDVTPEPKFPESATRRVVEVKSERLSKFHGRPVTLKVGVVLPSRFAADTTGHYLLAVHVGGFGSRYTSARRLKPDDRFVQVALDGTGPFGDPYQVNSDVSGPYGDAVVHEVLPAIESRFRCGGPGKRFLTGGSTGGWVSLALQVYYPKAFAGAWGQCLDPLDFRAFQLTDLSRDQNMYVDATGKERPAMRRTTGEPVYTVREEVRAERVLADGGKWELSGGQWASWNATYGPRGPDGNPVPLWDGETGVIDRTLLAHWAKSDLRRELERRWPIAGNDLAGKLHVWVGGMDNYYLERGVRHFRAAAESLTAPAWGGTVVEAPGRGHESGWDQAEVLNRMAQAAGR